MGIGYDGGLTCAFGVGNLEHAIAWYRDVLGFTLIYHKADMAWCEMASPVARVSVGLGQVEKVGPKGGATLTFGVTDMKQARAAIEEAGVRLDGDVRVIPGLALLQTFYDPDGNTLMFYQDTTKDRAN